MHDNKLINKDDYLLSTKDLNTLNNIGKLIDIGVDSLKIEGRMKSKEYVYLVTKMYRKAIDSYVENNKIDIKEEDIINLKKIFNRKYTKGFLNNENNNDFINPERPNHIGINIGKVISYNKGFVKIKLTDNLSIKDGIRIISNEDYGTTIYKMKKNNNYVEEAFKDDIIEIKIEKSVNIDDIVVKTTDYKLVNEIDELIDKGRKIKIKGTIKCKLNEPIILKLSDSINNIEVKSEFNIEESINRPTTKEDIYKQINKLGNTIYEFDELTIINDDNIFINNKDLNEIRRIAIEKLNNKRLYQIPYKKEEYSIKLNEYNEEFGYSYLIHNIDDYNNIKDKAKDIITDNIDLFNEIVLDEKVILKLPRVLNEHPNYNVKVLIGV
jgi:putative protease